MKRERHHPSNNEDITSVAPPGLFTHLQVKIAGFSGSLRPLTQPGVGGGGGGLGLHCNVRIGTAARSAGPSAHVYPQLVDQVKVPAADI